MCQLLSTAHKGHSESLLASRKLCPRRVIDYFMIQEIATTDANILRGVYPHRGGKNPRTAMGKKHGAPRRQCYDRVAIMGKNAAKLMCISLDAFA